MLKVLKEMNKYLIILSISFPTETAHVVGILPHVKQRHTFQI